MEYPDKSEPIESWISFYTKSNDSDLYGKSTKELTSMALEAYYEAQRNEEAPLMAPKNANIKPRINIIKLVGHDARAGEASLMGTGNVKEETLMKENLNIKRALAITKLALCKDTDNTLIESYVEHTYSDNIPFSTSIQTIRESFEKFCKSINIIESTSIKAGNSGSVKCIERWGACKVGDVYEGAWRQAAFPHQLRLDIDYALPGATRHPDIFLDKNTGKLSISKQFELL